MAIARDNDKFILRPGIVNKKGHLPDPSELVCIEVPKVFDQCLFKRCLTFAEGPDTNTTDEELRSNPLRNPKKFLGCRDFNIQLLSVDKTPITDNPSFKRLVISFKISFYADFLDTNNTTQCEFFEINRTELIPRFYCPDSISQISSSLLPVKDADDLDTEIIKLEMVAACLDNLLTKNDENCDVLDITLGFHLIVKCELIVQLLIPTFDYCPIPSPCAEEPIEDPCEKFEKAPVPKFYPDQNLEPLFPCDDDINDVIDDQNYSSY